MYKPDQGQVQECLAEVRPGPLAVVETFRLPSTKTFVASSPELSPMSSGASTRSSAPDSGNTIARPGSQTPTRLRRRTSFP